MLAWDWASLELFKSLDISIGNQKFLNSLDFIGGDLESLLEIGLSDILIDAVVLFAGYAMGRSIHRKLSEG